MARLGEAFVVIRARLGPLKKGLAAARKAVKRTMQVATRTIKRMGLLMAGVLTGAIFAAAKFEKQMAMVSTMLTDKMMPVLTNYKKKIMALAKEFGQSTKTLAKGLYDILSASIAVEKASGVLRTATKAAIAGMTETEIAADAITTIINAYGISADRAEEISDKLFTTVKRGKITFEELAGSIGRTAATAAIAGMRVEELFALVATLTRAGINANEAMTAISGVMRAFLKPTKDATETAEEFGLELSSATLKGKGFVEAVKMLNKASAEQLAMIVPNIRAFKALAAGLKDVKGLTYDLNLITNKFSGEAEKAYKKMANTAAFQFDRIKQQAIATFRALGESLLGPFRRAMKLFSNILKNIENWMGKNRETIKSWAHTIIDYMVKIIKKFQEWFYLIRSGYAEEAFQEMTENIIRIMKAMWETLRKDVFPAAIEIGKAMGKGIKKGIENEFPTIAKIFREPGKAALRTTLPGFALSMGLSRYAKATMPKVMKLRNVGPEAAAATMSQTGGGMMTKQILAELQEISKNTKPEAAR